MATQQPRYITPEVAKQFIGQETVGPPEIMGRNDMEFYARAIRHPHPPDPVYSDEHYARKTRFGGMIAPPTFLTRYGYSPATYPKFPVKLPRVVNGGVDFEMYEPIRPGDVITAHSKVTDVYEKTGQAGPLVFVVQELTFVNQFGETVGRNRRMRICY